MHIGSLKCCEHTSTVEDYRKKVMLSQLALSRLRNSRTRITILTAVLLISAPWHGQIFGAAPNAVTQGPDEPSKDSRADRSRVDFHLNQEALRSVGVRIAMVADGSPIHANGAGYLEYSFTALPLEFDNLSASAPTVGSSRIRLLGGILFGADPFTIDLRNALLRPVNSGLMRWTIEDSSGKIWLELDHAHVEFKAGEIEIRDANLRLTKAFAEHLNHLEWTGMTLGGADLIVRAPITTSPAAEAPTECQAPWPNKTRPADVRLILMQSNTFSGLPDTIAFERCVRGGGGGGGGSDHASCTMDRMDGMVVFAPDASLRNVGNSAIPWYPRYSGRHPPNDNDQHPFLTWNLYREDEDGTLRQIARSGVKHAFFAVNADCPCRSGHIVYPKCVDTYSSYNNDTLEFLGSRHEVLPAFGIWGHCDPSDSKCTQLLQLEQGDETLKYRLAVSEHELETEGNKRTKFYFEYGYSIRDAEDPTSATGSREVFPRREITGDRGVRWSLNPGPLENGPVIDRWANSNDHSIVKASNRASTPNGTARVAVRVTRLPNGNYRYRYAIANIDYVAAKVSGHGDNLIIGQQHGISRIAMLTNHPAEVSSLTNSSRDLQEHIEWKTSVTQTSLVWDAPSRNELTWGTLMSIGFDSPRPPRTGVVQLLVPREGLQPELISVRTHLP